MPSLFLSALLLTSFTQCSSSLVADEPSFTFAYNGGKIMTQPVTVALLWFGNGWLDSSREVLLNAIASLTDRGSSFKNSDVPTLRDWWQIVEQYSDRSGSHVTSSVKVGPQCFYTGSSLNMTLDRVVEIGKAAFNTTSTSMFGANLRCTQVFDVGEDMVYHVMFNKRVMFLEAERQRELINSCSGDIELEVFEGVKVKMGWARVAADQCSWIFDSDTYLGPPNGDEKMDNLVSYTLAKIAEEVTNRDGRGWSTNGGDGSGFSVSSVCSSLESGVGAPPLFRDAVKNVSFNVVGANGYRYMVQHIWNQKIRNCAVKLSDKCEAETITLVQPKGYLSAGITVNHTAGLQPYPPNQKCLWKIQFMYAKFIAFTLIYQSITTGDSLRICKSETLADCYVIQPSNGNAVEQFKLLGSTAFVKFTTGDHVSPQSRGWELRYSSGNQTSKITLISGLCDGKEDLYELDGIISYTAPSEFSYVQGLSCKWVLHGKPGTPVSLSFTRINTSKDLDFLAIYNGTEQHIDSQVHNFSGLFSKSELPQINLTGKVIVLFTTQTDQGTGWSANFQISSPIKRGKSPLFITIIMSAALLVGVSLVFIALASIRLVTRVKNRGDSNRKLKLIRVELNREHNQIGEGSSAVVYRGNLPCGAAVAMKSQREPEAKTDLEEEILLKASHQTIVSLLGYTHSLTGQKPLVFEYMGGGNLSWNLRERGEILNWERRLEIAIHVSSALHLLHMYSNPPIYHGNVGSENVLLDNSWNAKLCGFGRANYCKMVEKNVGNQIEMADDVFNFGLLLVELLRGQPWLERPLAGVSENPYELLKFESLDPRLEIPRDECKIIGLEKLGEIANWCISVHGVAGEYSSPQIGDVVLGLKQVKQLMSSHDIS